MTALSFILEATSLTVYWSSWNAPSSPLLPSWRLRIVEVMLGCHGSRCWRLVATLVVFVYCSRVQPLYGQYFSRIQHQSLLLCLRRLTSEPRSRRWVPFGFGSLPDNWYFKEERGANARLNSSFIPCQFCGGLLPFTRSNNFYVILIDCVKANVASFAHLGSLFLSWALKLFWWEELLTECFIKVDLERVAALSSFLFFWIASTLFLLPRIQSL